MVNKIIEGLSEAVAYARIDALWRRTKKGRGEGISAYDWGYRDGVHAARELFGATHVVKARKGAVKTRSQIKNPLAGTWTKRDDKSGKFADVRADPKPFKGVRKEKREK